MQITLNLPEKLINQFLSKEELEHFILLAIQQTTPETQPITTTGKELAAFLRQ